MKLHTALVLVALLAPALAKKYGKIDDPAVKTFAKEFAIRLQADAKGAAILAIAKLPKSRAAPIYQRVLQKFLEQRGAPAAEFFSHQLAKAIAMQLHKVTPEHVATVVGYNLANALQKNGDLALDKAPMLATEAVQDFAVGAGDVSTPDLQVKAIFDGYEHFFARYGYKIPQLIRLFVSNIADLLDTPQFLDFTENAATA